jgi:pimeloyl-ACP methyl ester carboxylesterase
MRSLAVGGARLETRWLAPAASAAPTIVLLHGGLACLASWRDVPEALAAATGCGVLAYSRLGHGASDAAPRRWPATFMHDEARDVLPAVLAAAAVRQPILVGHSDGASIALLYAASHPPPAPAPLGVALMAPHVFVEELTLASIARLREEPVRGERLARLARRHGDKAERLLDAWTEVWLRADFASWTIADCVAAVGCPMLVVQGDRDEYGTLAQVDAIVERAGGELDTLLLAGGGHVPFRDRREETLDALARFCSLIARRAAASG